MIQIAMSPALIGTFIVVSIAASIVHAVARSPQKIPLTLVAAGAASIWGGMQPIDLAKFMGTSLAAWTVFQVLVAAAAFWVRDAKT